MIGHSLGRMETCFPPALSVLGAKHISNPDFGAILKKGERRYVVCFTDLVTLQVRLLGLGLGLELGLGLG